MTIYAAVLVLIVACVALGSADSDETTTNKRADEQCVDRKKLCPYWYLIGECTRNPGYMNQTCRRSCGVCKSEGSILGCKDTKDMCGYWAKTGECQTNPGFMLIHCRVSCKACNPDPGPGTGKTTTKTPILGCRDSNSRCGYWAKQGECKKNPTYMKETCRVSCGVCNPDPGPTKKSDPKSHATDHKTPILGCRDANNLCSYWAKKGECNIHKTWMKENCRVSCGICNPDPGPTTKNDIKKTPILGCRDSNTRCGYWAKQGECKKNPSWMKESCKVSCGVCNPDPGPTNITDTRTHPADKKDIISANTTTDTPTKVTPILGCRDSRKLCSYWTKNGACKSDRKWMMEHCRVSCGGCIPDPGLDAELGCADQDKSCIHLAKDGGCSKNPDYMHKMCAYSCDRCA